MSIMVAAGKGATAGVLFKNAEAIEVMRKIDTLVVDKTGTLTVGKPKLVTVAPAAMSFSSVSVVGNALRLRGATPRPLPRWGQGMPSRAPAGIRPRKP